jgi:hypothetical protein
MTTPGYENITLTKQHGGQRPLWKATHPGFRIVGTGNTADNAIKNFQEQFRRVVKAGQIDTVKIAQA